MACESFASSDDHPNKCKNCGEYVSAHIDTDAADDDN